MLLQVENTSVENIQKLMDFARGLNLRLSVIDQDDSRPSLPGKPLSALELQTMIRDSRASGAITMQNAHEAIRKNFHAD